MRLGDAPELGVQPAAMSVIQIAALIISVSRSISQRDAPDQISLENVTGVPKDN
jgi:hypothetical protein